MKTFHRNIFFITILLLSFCNLHAATTGHIIGQVIEKETNKPVPFAEIIFENKMDKITVTANEYGYYYANHLPTGKYQMRLGFNNRIFVMNNVRVYDGYSNEVNFFVSTNTTLSEIVEVQKTEPLRSDGGRNDIRLASNTINQPTQSLSEVLSMQPGIDVRGGTLYVKGSNQVRFFIDGTPVLGQPVIQRIW